MADELSNDELNKDSVQEKKVKFNIKIWLFYFQNFNEKPKLETKIREKISIW